MCRKEQATRLRESKQAFTGAMYGWTSIEGQLVRNPEQTQVIRQMRRMHQGGCSYNLIGRILNNRGIATARGGRWHATTVRNLLVR